MPEIWDGYYQDGTLAGVDLIRNEPIPDGLYHIVVEILVKHIEGDYLLMQRDFAKPFGGYYEASAGGSILKGEDPITGAKRELFEETGIRAESLTLLKEEIGEKTFFYSYLCITDCAKDSVILQEGETISYRWIDKATLISYLNSDQMIESQKARYKNYFESLQLL